MHSSYKSHILSFRDGARLWHSSPFSDQLFPGPPGTPRTPWPPWASVLDHLFFSLSTPLPRELINSLAEITCSLVLTQVWSQSWSWSWSLFRGLSKSGTRVLTSSSHPSSPSSPGPQIGPLPAITIDTSGSVPHLDPAATSLTSTLTPAFSALSFGHPAAGVIFLKKQKIQLCPFLP